MISGPLINELLTHPENRLSRLCAADIPTAEIVDELYWTALSRGPREEEREAAAAHLEFAADRRRALEDLAWALVNSHEFLLRR
jgi:hypothetical protein